MAAGDASASCDAKWGIREWEGGWEARGKELGLNEVINRMAKIARSV